MPCTLEPWEEEAEERRDNREKFGLDMTDRRVLTEAACQACRALDKAGLMKKQSRFLQRWWAEHQKIDQKRRKK